MKSRIVMLLCALAISVTSARSADWADCKFVNAEGKPISESDVPGAVLKAVKDDYVSHHAPICTAVINCRDEGKEETSTLGIAADGRGLRRDDWVTIRKQVLSPTKLLVFSNGFDALWRLSIQKAGFSEIKLKMPDIEDENAFVWLGEHELRRYDGPLGKVCGTISGADGKPISESGVVLINMGTGPDRYGVQVPIVNGRYEASLSPGDYWFVFETDNYSGESAKLKAEAAKTVQHNVVAYPRIAYQFRVNGQDTVALVTGSTHHTEISDKLSVVQYGKQIELSCKDNDTIIRIKRHNHSKPDAGEGRFLWWGMLYEGDQIQLVDGKHPDSVVQTLKVKDGPMRPKT